MFKGLKKGVFRPQGREKSKKEGRGISNIEFYTELLFSLLGKGNIDKPDSGMNIPEGWFYYATNKIFTKDKVKKMIFINELPMEIDSDMFKDLKIDVSEYGELRVLKRIKPYKLNRDSWRTRNRIKIWRDKTERFEEELSRRSAADEIYADKDKREEDERTRWMIGSWKWVNETESRRDEMCTLNIVLELIADNLENLYIMEDIVVNRLRVLGVYYGGVFVQTNEYYKAFSPCGNVEDNMLVRINYPHILSDRVVSQMFEVSNGMVGDRDGLYLGSDVFTSLPVTYDVKKGNDAINILLTASTGEGKSGFSKGLMTYLEIEDLYSIDVDYEGDEYLDVGRAHGAKIISMGQDSSSYFDTTEIGDLTGDPEIDGALKDEAIGTTKLVFDVLTDYEKGMNYKELSLFNDMILRVYKKRGVTEDPKTWVRSKGASYEELYRELYVMREDKDYRDSVEDIDEFIKKLRVYFDGNIYSNIFKNRISINDILGYKRIIFSFGMRGKTENTIDKRSLSLRQLFVGYLIILISNYNKTALNRLTVVKLEELQRYLTHEASGKLVNDIVTGGRKRGMIVFLITNSPLQIVDIMSDEDNSELSKHAKSIKNNLNGFLIGRLQDETSERLAKVFPWAKDCLAELKLINNDDDFKYCFLLHFKGESSIVKFEIPLSLVKSSMYTTRVDQTV